MNNVVPFSRLARDPKPLTQAQREEERRAAILAYVEKFDEVDMTRLAEYLADKTDLSIAQALDTMTVTAQSALKAQADGLAAVVAKRRLKQRCIDILTCSQATADIELAKWLALETDVSASVALEVMIRTREATLKENNRG